jgi:hypothetical protein
MAERNYLITQAFTGYRNKTDDTKIEEDGVLVSGSQNVVSTDGDTVAIRGGYTLFGGSQSLDTAIESSYEWRTHRATEFALRSTDDEIQYYDDNSAIEDWVTLLDGMNAVDFNFTEYWDTTEAQDALLFVNGDSSVFYWSGGKATFASAAAATITLQGATTWGEEGFLTAGTRSVIIEGTTYAYTGGESTDTLTGVTPDPSVAGHTVGASCVQAIRTTANSAITSLPNAFQNDLIEVLDNQVWVGSLVSREIYVSKINDYEDFGFSAPRLVGEGVLLTLDQATTAFVVQDESMFVSAGTDYWFQSELQVSEDLLNETLLVNRLKTSPQQAALSQGAVGNIKNLTVFISNEPTLDSLGNVENYVTSQSRPISDPIKVEFDTLDFTDAHIKYFKNNLYIALPKETKLLIYNIEKGFWEAPQILPAGRLAIYDGDLYLHSNSVDETYKLFQGTSDVQGSSGDKLAINAIARFNYQNYGARAAKKFQTEWFSEGYISTNTDLTLKLRYDYVGAGATVNNTISGDVNQDIIFYNTSDPSLGKTPLGKAKLAGDPGGLLLNKFRVINELAPLDYYEIQAEYSTNDIDQDWEILAFGSDATIANNDNNEIKQ